MIRHSKSFFISITIHLVLLLSVFYAWNSYISAQKVDVDTMKECDMVHVNLCNVNSKKIEKEKIKPVDNPKPKPKEKKVEKIEPVKKETLVKREVPVRKEVPVKEKKFETKQEELIEETKESPEEVKEIPKEKSVEEVVEKSEVEEQKAVEKSQAQLAKERQIKQESLTKEYIQVNTQKIAALLRDNLYYPRSARKRNITGQITVKFTLGSDSHVSDVVVIKSNSEILSRAAIKTIEDLSGKFPKPQEVITLRVPIGYELN